MPNSLTFSKELQRTLADIEIPEDAYKRAEQSYRSLSEWLVRDNSRIKRYNLDIFLQASIKLGTAVRPVTEDGSYDVDVVCVLQEESINKISQADLKHKLGIEIKDYVASKRIKEKAKDGKRCWTLLYQDSYNFHIDVLVAVPSRKRYPEIVDSYQLRKIVSDADSSGINITDKRHPHYYQIANDWNLSNPKGYYQWFQNVSKFYEMRKSMAFENQESIEKIPAYRVKTPLQRFVQLLKRHAEVMFDGRMEYCPTSIIITTLAAHAYLDLEKVEHHNLDSLLREIIKIMPKYIIHDSSEKIEILNPVNPNENFADKWSEEPRYFSAFQDWHKQLLKDFGIGSQSQNDDLNHIEVRKSMGLDFKVQSSAQREQFLNYLPYHQALRWPIIGERKIQISVEDYTNKFMPVPIGDAQRVLVNRSIRFRVNDVISSSQNIYWQVTNTGAEAKYAGDLRGEFQAASRDGGSYFRMESTRYVGQHYVQAFLIENGKCVGKSAPFQVNIVRSI